MELQKRHLFVTPYAYYFANALAREVEEDRNEFFFWLDLVPSYVETISKPHRHTILHDLIVDHPYLMMDNQISDLHEDTIAENRKFLSACGIKPPKWLKGDRISRSQREKFGELVDVAFDVVVPSVFQILFSDTSFLFKFHKLLSHKVSLLEMNSYPQYLQRDGVFARQFIPAWLRKGIWYRDKATCQGCSKDLSGIFKLQGEKAVHYDHIIPLAEHGSNDPTNFQLLCQRCNQRKKAKLVKFEAMATSFW